MTDECDWVELIGMDVDLGSKYTAEAESAILKCKAQRKKEGKDPDACFAIITAAFKKAGKDPIKKKSKEDHQGLTKIPVNFTMNLQKKED